MKIFDSIDALRSAEGTHLGKSEWRAVTQDDINGFAELTGDHQWIHVDEELAKTSAFGGTVGHGFLTLGLVSIMAEDVYRYENFTMSLNYGADRLRFPSPLPVGARIRGSFSLASVKPISIGYLVQVDATVEIEGSDKPACFVEWLVALQP